MYMGANIIIYLYSIDINVIIMKIPLSPMLQIFRVESMLYIIKFALNNDKKTHIILHYVQT
jgi:hypothetical protein